MLDTFIYLYLYIVQTSGHSLKQEGVYVTSRSTEHTFINIFLEDTCIQVICLWYIMISFRLWFIYDDDDFILIMGGILQFYFPV